ncbi:glycosyltransferase [Paenibacillus alkalitolerans]|uniref:glycosyltransferase n=1 Tax=Paenibacillus alkalitolerans TaxID=2799335 RepID=UPI0018F76254|nr:glycosyltransferase [Paenibacillus alkalitolerans]
MDTRERLNEQMKSFMKLKLNIFLQNHAAMIRLPIFDKPDVSIILVLYNKAEYTLLCLETIKAYADVPYEIIIVDNASADETSSLLSKIQNAVIVRNNENSGYLEGCNQGAELARGKWLLFLNNDTQITPSLLSILKHTAENTANCAAVGGKLIYPDGKLQEAGSIIWNDGTSIGYGRGDDPFKPEFSYRREADYCSGACLLVNKEIFYNVGMFDQMYHPGYYEETDLSMKIREQGYKVIYQPAAVVIHYEFGSSSVIEALTYQNRNRELFFRRWENRMNDFNSPSSGIQARVPRRQEVCKILVIDDRIPIPQMGCGYPRSFKLLEGLAKSGCAVTLFPLQFPEKAEPYTYLLQQQGIEVLYSVDNEKLNLHKHLSERNNYYDLVMISRLHNIREAAHIVKNTTINQKIIYDAEAVFSYRDILKQEIIGNPLPEQTVQDMIRQEIDLMKQADKVVTVSEREKRFIESYGIQNVNIVSHHLGVRSTPKTFERRRDLLYVGSFTPNSPNEDAAIYFTREVYPLVFKELGIKLWIVGINMLESVKSLATDHINVTGIVPDLWNYYNDCRVFVVPTRYASGIPLKLLECMSHGVPSVVTPLIAEQLGLDEETVLVGNDPRDMAEKIIRCYTDKTTWQRLRRNGLKFVEKEYNSKVFQQQILQLKEFPSD